MTRLHNIQTKQGGQGANGGFTFAKCKELSAEIIKRVLGRSDVSCGLIKFADLPGADRELPRSWQRDISMGEDPREGFAPKAEYYP